MPVISGETKMQPVYVGDVADAVLAGLIQPDTPGKTYELGGPKVWTFREILAYILHETQRKRPLVNIPMGLARFQAALAEKLPTKPFTRDQLLLLSRDNVVAPGLQALPTLASGDAGRADRAGVPGSLPARRRQAGARPT